MEDKGQVQKELGRQVRRWRKARGWSQEDLADRLSMQQTSVSRIERGVNAVSVEVVATLAQTFGVTLDELLPLQRNPDLNRWVELWTELPTEARADILSLCERLLKAPD